ncbi:hypothetical protein, partial [Microcoleus sp. herbarium14]|uniref:hypothetical protein n=1 Tax=Microcoleus sp. herbarium14 TaxID=3055439 RepID=UPI002FD0FF50
PPLHCGGDKNTVGFFFKIGISCYIKSGSIGINIRNQETAFGVSLQLIWCRETALPSPLSCLSVAGIDIS